MLEVDIYDMMESFTITANGIEETQGYESNAGCKVHLVDMQVFLSEELIVLKSRE